MNAALDLGHLDEDEIDAVRRALQYPKYELIPLDNAVGQSDFLPAGATVSVTASPSRGMGATVDLSVELSSRGFKPMPHLSARLTSDRSELETVLKRLDHAGIESALIVGGDTAQPGEFPDGLSLLMAMEEIGHTLVDIGVPGYPEGHPFIEDQALAQALKDKASYASFVTTQMCFMPGAISGWIEGIRDSSLGFDVFIGVPGVAELAKLLKLSIRIGVGDSRRFLSKNMGLAANLVRPGRYTPDKLILGLARVLADPVANVQGFHIYTFNQVETTEQWRREMLGTLG